MWGSVLQDGKIAVQGSGPELQARVNELNQAGPDEFALVAAPVNSGGEASPAVVPGGAANSSPASTEQLFQAYVREVGAAGLQAVAYANGHFVIRTGGTNTARGHGPGGAGARPPDRGAQAGSRGRSRRQTSWPVTPT